MDYEKQAEELINLMQSDLSPIIQPYQDWIDGGLPVENPEVIFLNHHEGADPVFASFIIRDAFIQKIGFAIVNSHGIKFFASLGPILEVGAGSGYISHLIRHAGGDAIATDIAPNNKQPQLQVEALDAQAAIEKYPGRTILSSWPSLEQNWLADAARSLAHGQKLIVIGEGPGGATASDAFFDLIGVELTDITDELTSEQTMPLLYSAPAIHDKVSIFERAG